MAEDVFADAQHRMNGAVEALQRELQTVRTGRAAPALVERLVVNYYDTPGTKRRSAISKRPSRKAILG
jgi:ribosome recycling factor